MWLVWLFLFQAAWGQAPRYLPVLCYHQIHARADSEMVTTPARFREQLDFLRSQGYQSVNLQQADLFLQGKLSVRQVPKPLLITFDDGYDGVFRYAYPELKKRHMKAVVFLIVSQVDRNKPTAHLALSQLKIMAQSGVFEFGSHSYALHVPIPQRWAEGRISAYAIQKDLIRSRQLLADWLGKPVSSLAWPYGHYDDDCVKLAQRCGFRLIFTTDYGYNLPASGTLRIRRIRLSSEYDTVDRLRSKLATGG